MCRFPFMMRKTVWFIATIAVCVSLRAEQPELADAIEAKDFVTATRLIDSETSVQAAQPDGMTALHWAVRYDEVELAKRLCEKGAQVDATNRYGITPLWLACQNGSESGGATVAGCWCRS